MWADAGIKERIRQFVLEDLAYRKGITDFTDDESLIQEGVVDSLGIFRIVSFVEENFRIRVRDDEINAENFQTIGDMERFVISHLGGSMTSGG
jgi:acyl carrier protein